MACRLVNTSGHLIRIDLRNSASLTLAPGQLSGALREELLYENMHIGAWEREGKLRRVPARFSEVLAQELGGPVAPVEDDTGSAQAESTTGPLEAESVKAPPEAEGVKAPPESESVTELPEAEGMTELLEAESVTEPPETEGVTEPDTAAKNKRRATAKTVDKTSNDTAKSDKRDRGTKA